MTTIEIINPFQMNQWRTKKLLLLVLSIQIILWILIILDTVNFQIPILRQLFGFIYLTFVPGILIVKLLNLKELGKTETILYTIGLSIASVMLVGFFMNLVYPFFGIKPITILNLTINISIFVFILCLLNYVKNENYFKEEYINFNNFSPITLFLILIPFLAIFGTYLLNSYGNNVVQMILILIISLMVPISLKWLPTKFYPLIIFVLSISLLYHTSLISNYLWGADVNMEYFLSKLVLDNSFWDLSIHDNYNAMLSIMILGPVYSLILKMNIILVYKIIYPTIFSLIPVGLFIIFKKQTNSKIAFLASFFFISIYSFYTVMPALARQEIAELFFVLLIGLIVNKNIKKSKASIMLLVFGPAIIVSHYGLAYIFIFIMIIAFLIIIIPLIYGRNHSLNNYLKKFKQINIFNFLIKKLDGDFIDNKNNKYAILNINYILFFIVFAITWFMAVSSSSIFNIGVDLGNSVISSILDIFNPVYSQGTDIMVTSMPLFQSIERYFHIIYQLLIATGIISVLINRNWNFDNEFKVLSIVSLVIAGAGVILPYVASALNSDRLYHITLFFLAPYLIIGLITVFHSLDKVLKNCSINLNFAKKSLYFSSLFLIILFLFSSAFFYQIFEQPKIGRFALDNNVDYPRLNNQEVSAATWLDKSYYPKTDTYADVNKAILLAGGFTPNTIEIAASHIDQGFPPNSYIFLSTYNIKYNQLLVQNDYAITLKTKYIQTPSPLFKRFHRIYDNGGAQIIRK